MKEIEYDLADVIIGRPHGFTVGRKHFYLYPITLAKMFLLKRQMEHIEVNDEQLRLNPYLETLRIVKSHRETCCQIIAYHTAPNTQKDLFCTRSITIRKNFFAKELDDEELSSLMIIVLTSDKTDEFLEHLGLKEEHEKMHGVLKIKHKHDKNTKALYIETLGRGEQQTLPTKKGSVSGRDFYEELEQLSTQIRQRTDAIHGNIFVSEADKKEVDEFVKNLFTEIAHTRQDMEKLEE